MGLKINYCLLDATRASGKSLGAEIPARKDPVYNCSRASSFCADADVLEKMASEASRQKLIPSGISVQSYVL